MITQIKTLKPYRFQILWIVTFLLLSCFSPPAATAAKSLNNLLLEFESNVNDEAWDEQWDDRYESWEQECQQAKQPQVIAKLLLELETNLTWEAVTDQWKTRRESWMAAGSKAITMSQVAKLLWEFETYMKTAAIDEEWQATRKGWYTEELLKVMETPGPKLEEVFKQVLAKERKRTQGSQIPWYNTAFEGDFYFNK